jgi:hypothetical protein
MVHTTVRDKYRQESPLLKNGSGEHPYDVIYKRLDTPGNGSFDGEPPSGHGAQVTESYGYVENDRSNHQQQETDCRGRNQHKWEGVLVIQRPMEQKVQSDLDKYHNTGNDDDRWKYVCQTF